MAIVQTVFESRLASGALSNNSASVMSSRDTLEEPARLIERSVSGKSWHGAHMTSAFRP